MSIILTTTLIALDEIERGFVWQVYIDIESVFFQVNSNREGHPTFPFMHASCHGNCACAPKTWATPRLHNLSKGHPAIGFVNSNSNTTTLQICPANLVSVFIVGTELARVFLGQGNTSPTRPPNQKDKSTAEQILTRFPATSVPS